MKKSFYTAQDLAQIAGISDSSAYKFIREMNAELEEAGYLVVRGRVPASYARKRFSLEEVEQCQD